MHVLYFTKREERYNDYTIFREYYAKEQECENRIKYIQNKFPILIAGGIYEIRGNEYDNKKYTDAEITKILLCEGE